MKTRQFTVNNVGDPEPVVVQTVCSQVTVGEDEEVVGYPTQDFKVRKPEKTDDTRYLGAGKTYTFRRHTHWNPGDIAGYVETVGGSTTFFQDEE